MHNFTIIPHLSLTNVVITCLGCFCHRCKVGWRWFDYMQKFVTVVFIHSHSALCLPCVDSSLMHGVNLLRWSFCIAHHPGEKKCISSLPPLLLYACMLVHVCKRWWYHCLVGWRKALPDSTVAWLFFIIGALGHKLADFWNVLLLLIWPSTQRIFV